MFYYIIEHNSLNEKKTSCIFQTRFELEWVLEWILKSPSMDEFIVNFNSVFVIVDSEF